MDKKAFQKHQKVEAKLHEKITELESLQTLLRNALEEKLPFEESQLLVSHLESTQRLLAEAYKIKEVFDYVTAAQIRLEQNNEPI